MSKDEWIWTITEVMEDFSPGMGVKLKWFHTGRRTTVGERVADTLWGHEGGGAGDAWGIGRVQQEECSVGQVAE